MKKLDRCLIPPPRNPSKDVADVSSVEFTSEEITLEVNLPPAELGDDGSTLEYRTLSESP